jgi:8-oxo-dGTP pyrophosphatase MutT (NUDIX family)
LSKKIDFPVYEKPGEGYFIYMNEDHLIWHELERREVCRTGLLTVRNTVCRSPEGENRVFTVIDCSDWAIVVPVLNSGKDFLMVRQWRHGSKEISLEFPGGVFEPGEDPAAAAARELREETAYSPGRIRKIGEFSPNPAIMSNRVHFFLAEDLTSLENQDLDEDEFVDVEVLPIEEVFRGIGRPPYVHALMGSAYALYLQATKTLV